ncbi:hypothetical protein BN1723_003644 [Verticillium longisporum]|uniref:Uncharacterized protein n=1 Tax=Verticillium longisporum TaxID=100787 RepID=A0A0G4M6A3_VERLO|nr:hypothetical protein BN1723_003644 [Verticillium longisporum]
MAASTTTDSTLSRPSSIAPPASRRLPRSRSQSFSSDRPSTIMSHSLMSPPLSVSPEAAFIAASAASQIVTNDHDSHADTCQASTNVTDVTMPSVQSSVNSQSALIKNNRQNDVIDEEDFMPKRTQRRVKDPYAIDFSDEDEDDLDGPPKPPQKQEESLADFLRNYQPPPEPVVQTPLANRPKKKASAPSLIGRFTRGINHGSQSQAATNRGAQASLAEPRSSSSRQAGGALGHTPIQVSMPPGYDQYGPIDGTRQPATQSSGRVPMKKYEPREASSAVTRTSDLASFLRDSEPPPQLNPPSLYSTQEQSSSGSGFSKMFGRRKKSSMA